jgi:hypothetical protein
MGGEQGCHPPTKPYHAMRFCLTFGKVTPDAVVNLAVHW